MSWLCEAGCLRDGDMGIGREKTAYCYFVIAASTSLPQDSYIRMVVAKSAIYSYHSC